LSTWALNQKNYAEFEHVAGDSSIVWEYFRRNTRTGKQHCLVCRNPVLKKFGAFSKESSTSTLLKHLNKCHQAILQEEHSELFGASSNQPTLKRTVATGAEAAAAAVPKRAKKGANFQREGEQAILKALVVDCRPLSMLDSPAMKEMFRVMAPEFRVPSRRTLGRLLYQTYRDIVTDSTAFQVRVQDC